MAAGRSPGRRPLQSPVKAVGGPRRKVVQELSRSPSKPLAYKSKAAGNVATPGVAVVSAEWLLQLRDEVANSPLQNSPALIASTSAQEIPTRSEGSPQRAAKPVRRPPARSVGVGNTPPPDLAPLAPHHASVGTDDSDLENERLKSQSTQTHGQHVMPETEILTKAIASPERVGMLAREAKPVVMQSNPVSQVSPHVSPSCLGRCDLFGNDISHAERERECRQLQARMLAEQVEEQRRRKEEEKQRLREQELEDERRIEREQRELQERHLREQRRGAPPENVNQVGQHDRSIAKETLTKPLVERRRLAVEGGDGADHGSKRRSVPSQRNTAAAYSGTGPWAQPDGNTVHGNGEGRERRRRRRRRTSTNYDTTWRSGNHSRFRETKDSAGYGTPDQPRSKSPTRWLGTAEYKAMASDTVTNIEKELHTTSEVKHRRRRTRDRILQRDPQRDRDDRSDHRERHDRSYESQWMNSPPGMSLDADSDDPRRRRRPGASERASAGTHEQVHELPLTYEGRMPSKMTEEDLRQQLGSLVSLCEQLLQERADRELSERAPRSERGGGRHSGGRRTERSDRSLPLAPVPLPLHTGGGSARGIEQSSARSHTSQSHGVAASAHGGRQSGRGRSEVHEPMPMPYADSHSADHDAIGHSVGEHSSPIRPNGHYPPPMRINDVSALEGGGWPPDALASFVAEEGRQPVQGLSEISPFAAPNGRGMSVRRHSQMASYSPLMSPPPVSRGGLNVQANFPGFGRSLLGHEDAVALNSLSSPPYMQNEHFALESPVLGRLPLRGPGQIPIGVRPSIQAQSAMLRELYPHGPTGLAP